MPEHTNARPYRDFSNVQLWALLRDATDDMKTAVEEELAIRNANADSLEPKVLPNLALSLDERAREYAVSEIWQTLDESSRQRYTVLAELERLSLQSTNGLTFIVSTQSDLYRQILNLKDTLQEVISIVNSSSADLPNETQVALTDMQTIVDQLEISLEQAEGTISDINDLVNRYLQSMSRIAL